MRTIQIGMAGLTMTLVITLALPLTVQAFSCANRWGGMTSHSFGSTSMSDRWGGSMTHTMGQGTTATGAYGGTAHHAEGSGYTTYTGANGATAYHSPYYGTAYRGYHPPATVAYYGSGCYNCMPANAGAAAAAGAVVGLAAGAVASSNQVAANANAANDYNAGYNAGAANTAATFAMGGIYAQLPSGCISPPVAGGATYFLCGNTWFQPASGANGVFYRVVPAP